MRTPARFALATVAMAAATLTQQAALAEEARMNTTVVTAARAETKLDETLADVRVITQEQISNSAGRSLAEILQRFAGVQMSSNGGRGNTQSIYIRGSKQVILLVDGNRFGSVTDGSPSLASLPLETIERIEVVNGPASALYGSDDIGGVIQIFTKQGKGAKKAWQPHASATLGSSSYKDANAGFVGAQNDWNYSLNVARVKDGGFSSTNAKSSYFDPDEDAFDQTSLSASLGYAFNRDWRIDANVMKALGTGDYDNGATQNSWVDSDAGTQQIKLTGNVLPHWKSYISAGGSKDDQRTYNINKSTGARGFFLFQTEQTEYKWGNEIKTPVGLVIAGLERLEQKVTSTTKYDVNKRDTDAAYAGLNGGLGQHSWQVNVRRDDNSQFGSFNTWGIGYGYQVLPTLRMYASRGRSLSAPTFNQLYYPNYGSPNLKPEEGLNTELGMNWSVANHHFKVVRFDNKVTNLIAGSPLVNIDRARKKGWSLGYDSTIDSWHLSANYEHLDAVDGKGLRYTVRMPEHQFTASVDKSVGAWKFGANALYVGKRTDTDGGWPVSNKVNLPSYTTVDAYAEYQFAKEWALQARVANLTDKKYETAYGYNQRGRAGYLTLKWAPK